MVLVPNRTVSPRRRIAGPSKPGSPPFSDVEICEDDGEGRTGSNDEEDRLNNGASGEPPDTLGTARDAQAFITPGYRDDACKSRCLQHADPEGPAGNRGMELAQKGRDRDIEVLPRH